jgi:hypothetical protein
MLPFAYLFNSILFIAVAVVALPAYVTFGMGGGWWGVGVLVVSMWLNAWAQKYLHNRKFRPPKPPKAAKRKLIPAPVIPPPVVAQTIRPNHAAAAEADFVRSLPPALCGLMRRGYDEGERKAPHEGEPV